MTNLKRMSAALGAVVAVASLAIRSASGQLDVDAVEGLFRSTFLPIELLQPSRPAVMVAGPLCRFTSQLPFAAPH
jgi:hypothetical protein